MHFQDAQRQYYLDVNNRLYIRQPYITPVKIGTDLVSLGNTSDVVQFTLPNYANRVIAFYQVKGTVSGGTMRLECSPITGVTNYGSMNIDKTFSSADSNAVVRVFNAVGPYHVIRARVTSAITGGAKVDVYIMAAR